MALVMGGSQGAKGVNELVIKSLPLLAGRGPDWQWFHLAGPENPEALRQAYAAVGLTAKIHSFFVDMELAMGGANACISRAGASSLAEIAALRLPSVLVPFPAATDDHQFHNAKAFALSGAARIVDQRTARPQDFVNAFVELMSDERHREPMQTALSKWHRPRAAEDIAQAILAAVEKRAQCSFGSSQKPDATSTDQRVHRGSVLARPGPRAGLAPFSPRQKPGSIFCIKRGAA
jgi:UDP-N-acetylglucosamine--N-acetylmuramyl-(pentapeptide) pyrophosphoryl-undecaprenol N-acetylglucosamine transferase